MSDIQQVLYGILVAAGAEDAPLLCESIRTIARALDGVDDSYHMAIVKAAFCDEEIKEEEKC